MTAGNSVTAVFSLAHVIGLVASFCFTLQFVVVV
jgi:hypothetical protein